LLLHGVTRNCGDWDLLLPELLRDWHVVALDHRGHGKSARASRYLVADYARDAAAFVRGAFSQPVTILGHSLGAMVALSVAAECPDLVTAAALEDPPFHTMGNAIADTIYLPQFTGMQEVARRGGALDAMTDALSEIRLPAPQGSDGSASTIRLGDLRDRPSLVNLAECLTQVDPAVFAPLIAGRWLDTFDHQTLWSRIACPTLLLQGDPAAGGAFTDADLALAQRSLSNSRHESFPGVGHQIHRTRPAEFLERFRRFTRR
jgi:pimeloyl-ACP methyl ester carboxylesterase